MIVFRVEHPHTGNGPYNPGDWAAADLLDGSYRLKTLHGPDGDLVSHPPPRGFYPSYGDKFGFLDRESYEKWFNANERLELGLLGYNLMRFEVTTEQLSWSGDDSGQVAFRRGEAEFLSKEKIA